MTAALFMLAFAVLAIAIITCPAVASDQVPGKPQDVPILLTGGDVYTVSGDVIARGQVLFDKGKIVAVGEKVDAPAAARRIDCAGKRVYPGLVAAGNDLGLVEIPSVRGSVDRAEPGQVNPNARAEVAVNPDSELIPVARANGVLVNLTAPAGGLFTGTSAVLQLDGWTWEEMTLKAPAAVHLTWPAMGRGAAASGAEDEPAADQAKRREEQLKAIDQSFADARAYLTARRAAGRTDGGGAAKEGANNGTGGPGFDARWEAMIPLLDGKAPLVVQADEVRQIQAAVALAAREKVKLIIFGGYDAPLCAELLKRHDVPVIIGGVQRLPLRPDAAYDEPFTLPERLRQAGVKFCINHAGRFGGSSSVRNLPYHAATAAAHGLPPAEALRSITLYPAQVLGVADRVGSIEPGRDATLFVADGDILETPTKVEMAFVQGRQVDLSSKHTRLWEKYREKYRRQRRD